MKAYQCYIPRCTREYFAECDSCGIEGCLQHIIMSSNLAVNNMPYSYFCQACHAQHQREYDEQQESKDMLP